MAAHRNPAGPVIQQLQDGRWVMIRERMMDDGGVVGIRTDVTQLKHHQQALEKSNAELESFAYVASHDLQEPLRKIQAFGGRLQERYAAQLDDRGQDFLRRMVDASSRMSRLIADLLQFSRLSTRTREWVSLDLNLVLRDVLSDLELAIDECGAHIEVADLPTIRGDYTQMRQVFQNLIGNAVKFRKPDLRPFVTIVVRPASDTRWIISVRDNGIGFEPRYAARIFEIFQRLHGRTEYTGTGIGLAVVRKIIELHGGTIEATADTQRGAVFTIEIPAQVEIAANAAVDEMEPVVAAL
jgi:light-regulated signal transduction histidine kinase (bacteriophytochrome)